MSYKAFVSSTYIDLKDHRACVISALRNAGIHVDPMEDWTSDSDEPKIVSVERMRDCDLCILLVGARRGHVPTDEQLSITQMEVKEANRLGIDVLPFLYDGTSAWPEIYNELKDDSELNRWREELSEHKVPKYFTINAKSLDNPVRDAIARWLQKQTWPEIKKAYLETIHDEHAEIRFLGIGHHKEDENMPLHKLFLEPNTSSQYIPPDKAFIEWPKTTSIIKLLSAKKPTEKSTEKKLVIIGDPGSGKSTLISWIVWNLARKEGNELKQALEGRIPIVMVMRELVLENVQSWDDLLREYFKHRTARLIGRPRHTSDFDGLLSNGQAVIMFDGLDEIPNPQVQDNIRRAIWDGMHKFGKCVWILTSRIVGYRSYHEDPMRKTRDIAKKREDAAQLYYIVPFNDEQIKNFATKWFTARDHAYSRAQNEANRFIDAIYANHYTTHLARIPNLLTMMALIYRNRALLPHGRALLYNEISLAYLQSIDEQRCIAHLGYDLEEQKQWLGRIGFEMQLRRYNKAKQHGGHHNEILVDGSCIREWLISEMQETGHSESNEKVAEAFLDEICRRSGILLPIGHDRFTFTHMSFQEYFAAFFLMSQFVVPHDFEVMPETRRDKIKEYAGYSIWHEALVYLVELTFSERRRWLKEIVFCIFGDNFIDITQNPSTNTDNSMQDLISNQVMLLARLAVDPHTGLYECQLKSQAISACCAFEANRQKQKESNILENTYNPKPNILQILFNVDIKQQTDIFNHFIKSLREAGVVTLYLADTPIVDITSISDLPDLQALNLCGSQVKDISPLKNITSLQRVDLGFTKVADITPLSNLTSLERLSLNSVTQLNDISPIENLLSLKQLDLGSTKINNIMPLSRLSSLQSLSLNNVTQVNDFGSLARLTRLQLLDLSSTEINDATPLANLISLQRLSLFGTKVSNIIPLANLIKLTFLDLFASKVTSVSALSNLKALIWLGLGSTQTNDITPLSKLTNLRNLDLSNTKVTKITPLSMLNNLKRLDIRGLDQLRFLVKVELPNVALGSIY